MTSPKIYPVVAVLTPTTGSPKVLSAIGNVSQQDYPFIQHHIVCDGPEAFEAFNQFDIEPFDPKGNVIVSRLGENVGKNGFYGHRVYASFPHLINADYIAFLDEDNWYERNHISSLMEAIGNYPFAYSLRSIYSEKGEFLIRDDCESLGKWPIYGNSDQYLIDTSSYIFKTSFLIQVCSLWHSGWGGDRNFLRLMRENRVDYTTSGKYTLNYRLDGNPNSVTKEFFEKGNAITKTIYGDEYPWRSK